VWHYLRDPTFFRQTHTKRQTDGRTDTTTACTVLNIASRGKNRPYCTAHQV